MSSPKQTGGVGLETRRLGEPCAERHCPPTVRYRGLTCKGMRRADYDQAFEAAQRWITEHGRYPQQREWEHRVAGRPTTRTIKRRWGWDELMTAGAGSGMSWLPFRERSQKSRWSAETAG